MHSPPRNITPPGRTEWPRGTGAKAEHTPSKGVQATGPRKVLTREHCQCSIQGPRSPECQYLPLSPKMGSAMGRPVGFFSSGRPAWPPSYSKATTSWLRVTLSMSR